MANFMGGPGCDPAEVRKEKVFKNLDSSKENGYDVSDWDVDDIIADLQAFAEDCEDDSDEELRPHVEAWLKKVRK